MGMMSFHLVIWSFFFSVLAGAAELPWIGVFLDSPKTEERKAVKLSDGVGLKVAKVASGSPLSRAGGQAGDLWWKFDGQILVNKRQMLVLLRSKSPGDSVDIDYYRKGELKSLSLILAAQERAPRYSVVARKADASSSRVLAQREQIARITSENQDLTLQSEGAGWRFKVIKEGTAVLSAFVTEDDLKEKIPPKWYGSFLVLRMTLNQQASSEAGTDEKRIRYVPRSKGSQRNEIDEP